MPKEIKEKINIIEFSDGERTIKCNKNGCLLITPLLELEIKKVKKGYIFKKSFQNQRIKIK